MIAACASAPRRGVAMNRYITMLCVVLSLLPAGCERREAPAETVTAEAAQSTTIPPATVLLQVPVELKRFEVPSQALLQWYTLRSARPALLLYANNPLLQSTTLAIQKNLMAQLSGHDQTALRFDNADPAILPNMTLYAALEAGLFSEVYWMMPVSEEMSTLSVETFRTQMIQFGALNEEEARALTLHNGIFSGTLQGVPFHALHPQADFSIKGPTAFHFDLSYLSPLYKGEIKTPLYPLIYQMFKHLRAQRVETVAASFSYSQISGEVALGSRFVGDVFAQIIEQPKMLDEKLPVAWKQRANALYLPELFNVEQARNILLQQAETNPDDASLHYTLYQVSRESSSTRPASLGHLAEAIQRDPVYALEYLVLAPMAREKGRPDEALRVLQLAHEANPDNPFIALELAQTIIAMDHGDIAVPVLQKLQNLSWSATIYPDMPKYLQRLLTEAGKE